MVPLQDRDYHTVKQSDVRWCPILETYMEIVFWSMRKVSRHTEVRDRYKIVRFNNRYPTARYG